MKTPASPDLAFSRHSSGMFRLRALHLMLAIAGLLSPALSVTAGETAPALMLARAYHPGISLHDYWVGEKYDGVRGYWDGNKLWTRGGQPVHAPAWFTAGWPKIPMDGELWAGREQFAKAVSTVRRQMPDDAAWRAMRFMVFDLPSEGGPFTQRLQRLNKLVPALAIDWVQPVAQSRVANADALQAMLHKTVKAGGEGLVLHRGASLYTGQRNDDLLKLKTHDDAEARVVAHIPGKGKYAGQLGALLVEVPAADGQPSRRFRLGTGFTDQQRLDPPAVGALVTYRYRGLNDSGLPRFASFMRSSEGGFN
jgi:DNA ligase-1